MVSPFQKSDFTRLSVSSVLAVSQVGVTTVLPFKNDVPTVLFDLKSTVRNGDFLTDASTFLI